MIRGFATAVLGSLALAVPASAFEVQQSVMQVSYKHNGSDYVYDDTVVPLLPKNACYNWFIKLAEANTDLTVIERMTLPQAIDWGTVATDPNDGIEVLQGGTLAQSTLPMTSDEDGWITHGWCVADGDPVGHHAIVVSVGDEPLASFDFDVVDPSNYSFPGAQSAPWTLRSANQTW